MWIDKVLTLWLSVTRYFYISSYTLLDMGQMVGHFLPTNQFVTLIITCFIRIFWTIYKMCWSERIFSFFFWFLFFFWLGSLILVIKLKSIRYDAQKRQTYPFELLSNLLPPLLYVIAKQSFTSYKSILQRWYHIVYKPYHHYLFHERQTLYRQDRRVLRG